MKLTVEQLEEATLSLDVGERAKLAERLIASLEGLSDAENERLWAEEAERRDLELDHNPSLAEPGEQVLKDAHARLS